jgi:hypothetical protein
MKVDLKYIHREQLAKHLPLRRNGFNMDYRAAFVIDFLKRRKPQQFYDHRAAKFVPLDEPEIQNRTFKSKQRTEPLQLHELKGYAYLS